MVSLPPGSFASFLSRDDVSLLAHNPVRWQLIIPRLPRVPMDCAFPAALSTLCRRFSLSFSPAVLHRPSNTSLNLLLYYFTSASLVSRCYPPFYPLPLPRPIPRSFTSIRIRLALSLRRVITLINKMVRGSAFGMPSRMVGEYDSLNNVDESVLGE